MSRIQPKELKEYPWTLRLLFRVQKKKYGESLLPSLLWGRRPKLLWTFFRYVRFFGRKRSPLSPSLRALVMHKVSEINDCPFCMDLNRYSLQKLKGDEPLSMLETCAVDYAAAVTENRVNDAQFACLKEHFSEDAIVELTALIAFQNLSSKFNAALGIEPHGFCKE